MEFEDFPFDQQTCEVLVTSMRGQERIVWNTKAIKWFRGELNHPEFDMDIEQCKDEYSIVENETLAVSGFIFTMKRKSATYQWTYFIPCFLMVILSWISFLIKPDAVPGRIGLLLTLLLMMINLSNTVSHTSPVSGRLNPLLAWIQTSIAFVFFALVEYASILYKAKFGGRKTQTRFLRRNQMTTRRVTLWMVWP